MTDTELIELCDRLCTCRVAFVADVRKHLTCLCHDSYKSRGMTYPARPWHVYAVELLTEEEFKQCSAT